MTASPPTGHVQRLTGTMAVISAGEDLDVYTAPQLREAAVTLTTYHRVASIIVDLSQTRWVDATGLAVLVGAKKRALEHGCEFALAGPSQWVRKVLATSKLDQVFTIYSAVPEVPAAVAEGED